MSTRSIAYSFGLAAFLVGCGDGGTAVRPSEEGPPGEVLKISYFRVNLEPKTKRPEPTYRVVVSESWRQVMGESPREPFAKAAPNKVFRGSANDPKMAKYIRDLRGLGLDRLKARNPDDFNPTELHQKAMNPQSSDFTRVITVGTDKSAKSYYYPDQQTSKDLIEIFYKCELLVSAIMDGHTLSVRVVTPRTAVPDK